MSFSKCFACVILFMAWASRVVVFDDTNLPKRAQCRLFLLVDTLLPRFHLDFDPAKIEDVKLLKNHNIRQSMDGKTR